MPTDDEIRRVLRKNLGIESEGRRRLRLFLVRSRRDGDASEASAWSTSEAIAAIAGAFMMMVATALASIGVAAQVTWTLGILLEIASWTLFAAGAHSAFILRRRLAELEPS